MAAGEREKLLALQRALSEEEFQTFKYLLEGKLPHGALSPTSRPELCRLLLQRFPGRALEVAADVLRHLGRRDLLRLHQLLPAGAEEEEEEEGEEGGRGEEGETPRKKKKKEEKEKEIEAPNASSSSSSSSLGGWRGESGSSPPPHRVLPEKVLLGIAQKLGKEWEEVGIGCLGLERSRLEQIREEEGGNAVMRNFQMLREWRRKEKGGATAPRLLACLAPARLDPEILQLLQGE